MKDKTRNKTLCLKNHYSYFKNEIEIDGVAYCATAIPYYFYMQAVFFYLYLDLVV